MAERIKNELRRFGVPATAGIVVLSLTTLSWTVPLGSSADDGSVRSDVIEPLSPHQSIVVDGVSYSLPITDWTSVPDVPLSLIDDETVWLARCIYSETKDPREMELVAWVVRNRVETGYRGRTTYESVVLDPYQFSAFNHDSPTRGFYVSLDREHEFLGWKEALRIAYLVRTNDGRRRPFSTETRHFYSEISMVGRTSPYWSSGYTPVSPRGEFRLDERRFRFYEDVL